MLAPALTPPSPPPHSGYGSSAPSLRSYSTSGRTAAAPDAPATKRLRSVPIELDSTKGHFRAPGLLSKAYTLERLEQMARGNADDGLDFTFDSRDADALYSVLGTANFSYVFSPLLLPAFVRFLALVSRRVARHPASAHAPCSDASRSPLLPPPRTHTASHHLRTRTTRLRYSDIERWCAPRSGSVLPVPFDADIVVNLFFSVLNDQTTKPPREVRRQHYFDGDVSMLESAEKRREAEIDIHWPKIVRMRSADPQFAVYYVSPGEERPKQLRAAPGENNAIDTILLFLHVAAGEHDACRSVTAIGGKPNLRDFKCNIESEDAKLELEVRALSEVLQEPRFLQRGADAYF